MEKCLKHPEKVTKAEMLWVRVKMGSALGLRPTSAI